MTYSDGKPPAMRHLEGIEGQKAARGGGCTARASNDTPSRQAAVWRSGQPLRFISTRILVHPFAANAAFLHGKACHWIRRESKTTENQVTRFPSGRRGPQSGAGVLYGKSLGCHSIQAGRRLSVRASFWPISPLGMTVCCPPTSSSRAGLPVVMSDRYSSLMKRRAERSPATMGLLHFGVRFRCSALLSSK